MNFTTTDCRQPAPPETEAERFMREAMAAFQNCHGDAPKPGEVGAFIEHHWRRLNTGRNQAEVKVSELTAKLAVAHKVILNMASHIYGEG